MTGAGNWPSFSSMSELFLPRIALEPGQRVAVFPLQGASGATIGYYGTVVGRLEDGRVDPRTHQVKRPYRVLFSGAVHLVDLVNILPLAPPPRSHFLDDEEGPLVELRFEEPAGQPSDEISGVYRIRGQSWGHFLFSKKLAATELIESDSGLGESVTWAVPQHDQLDANYVLRIFAEAMDRGAPPAVD